MSGFMSGSGMPLRRMLQHGNGSMGNTTGAGSMSGSGVGMYPSAMTVTGSCYDPDADWIKMNGVKCEGDDIGYAVDGSFTYICCEESGCNDAVLLAGFQDDAVNFFEPDCESPHASDCVDKYVDAYACTAKGLMLPQHDECAFFVRPGSCLEAACASECECDGDDVKRMPGSPPPPEYCEEQCEALGEEMAAPGCPSEWVGDGICDSSCMWPDALFDGGDCLMSPNGHHEIQKLLARGDADRNGTLSWDEFMELEDFMELDREEWAKFAGANGMPGEMDLDELFLLFNYAGTPTAANPPWLPWEEAAEIIKAAPIAINDVAAELFFFADVDKSGTLQGGELMDKFGLTEREVEFLTGDEDRPVDLFDLVAVVTSLFDGLKGDFWEPKFDYDMGMSTQILVKIADLNEDGELTPTEATALRISSVVFENLDLDGSMTVDAEEMLTVLRTIGNGMCQGLKIIDEYETDVMAQLPLIRPASCKILIQPGWNYARPFKPMREPVCNATNFRDIAAPPASESGSMSGSTSIDGAGSGMPMTRRLLSQPAVPRRSPVARVRAAMKKGLYRPSAKYLETRSAVMPRGLLPASKPNAKKQAHAKKRAAMLAQSPPLNVNPIQLTRESLPRAATKDMRSRLAGRHTRRHVRSLHQQEHHAMQRYRSRSRDPRRSSRHLKQPSLRVVGGDETDPLEFPFVVALERTCSVESFLLMEVPECMAPWEIGDLTIRLYDADFDGTLDLEENCISQDDFGELEMYGEQMEARSVPPASINAWYYDYLFEDVDENGDGSVDMMEWVEAGLSADLYNLLGFPVTPAYWADFMDTMKFMFAGGSTREAPPASLVLGEHNCSGPCGSLMDYAELPASYAQIIDAIAPNPMPSAAVEWFIANYSLSAVMTDFLECPPPDSDMSMSMSGSGSMMGSGANVSGWNSTNSTNFRRRRLLALQHAGKSSGGRISQQYCTGSLVHPGWVLTAAHCVNENPRAVKANDKVTIGVHADLGRETASDNKGCMEQFDIEEVLIHPGYDPETYAYDVALLKLSGESSYPPVELYDGGDLMFSDCKKLEPVAVGWGYTDYEASEQPQKLQSVKVAPVSPEDCMDAWYMLYGYQPIDPNTMMCMTTPVEGMPMGTCNGDSGGPLLAPFPDSKTGWIQIGITSWGVVGCGPALPEVYVRVSEVLQWILGPKALGMFPARGLELKVNELAIPDGASVEVYKGMAAVESKLLDELDSKCDAGMTYSDEGEGGMLIVMDTPPLLPTPPDEDPCDLECLKGQGLRAALSAPGCMDNFDPPPPMQGSGGAMGSGDEPMVTMAGACEEPMEGGLAGCELDDGMCMSPKCKLAEIRWENITAMARVGKAATGGLGMKAEKRFREEFGVWACLRDWDVDEQMACSVRPGELACFKFEEVKREFVFMGLNKDVKLVKPEMQMEMAMMERLTIHALPPIED